MAAPAYPPQPPQQQYIPRRNRSFANYQIDQQGQPISPGTYESGDPNDPNNPTNDPSPGAPGGPMPPGGNGGGGGGAPPHSFGQFSPGAPHPAQHNPVPYNPDERDVFNMFQQERNLAQGQGDVFNQQFGDQAGYNQSMGEGYDRQIPELYQDIWGGGGGYTQQEQSDINQSQGLKDLAWNPDAAASNYLSQGEQKGMTGDAMGGFNYFQNRAPYLSNFDAQEAGNQRFGVSQLKGNLDVVNDTTANIARARVGNMDKGLTDAADNPNLQMSSDYAKQAGMSDQEVNDAATLGGQAAGAAYSRTLDNAQSGMRAAGSDNPMAMAAMQRDLAARGGKDTAMATVDARLRARQAQRDAATGVESTRLSSSRDIAARHAQAAEDVGQLGAGVENQIGGRGVQSATTLGNTSANVENEIANRGVGVQQYINSTGAGLYNEADKNSVNRAGTLATNRQSTNLSNQENQFNRGYTLNKAGSDRGTTIANQHQQQQAEGRAAAMGQQGYFGSQYNRSTQNQLSAADLAQRGRQSATGGYAGWGNEQDQNGFGSNFERGFGGALGKTLGTFGMSSSDKGNSYSMGSGGGGYADGGDVDQDRDRQDPDMDSDDSNSNSMLVLNPSESFHLPDQTTILPLNANRETSPNGTTNPYYKMGQKLRPMFKDLALGPAEGHEYSYNLADEKRGADQNSFADGGSMHSGSGGGGGGGGNWIQGMHMQKGALHQQMGIPQDQPIPPDQLDMATHSSDPTLRHRATLAETFKGMHHGPPPVPHHSSPSSSSHADGGMVDQSCYADGGMMTPSPNPNPNYQMNRAPQQLPHQGGQRPGMDMGRFNNYPNPATAPQLSGAPPSNPGYGFAPRPGPGGGGMGMGGGMGYRPNAYPQGQGQGQGQPSPQGQVYGHLTQRQPMQPPMRPPQQGAPGAPGAPGAFGAPQGFGQAFSGGAPQGFGQASSGFGSGGGGGYGGYQARPVTQPSTIYRPNPQGGGPQLQSMSEEGPEIALSQTRNRFRQSQQSQPQFQPRPQAPSPMGTSFIGRDATQY